MTTRRAHPWLAEKMQYMTSFLDLSPLKVVLLVVDGSGARPCIRFGSHAALPARGVPAILIPIPTGMSCISSAYLVSCVSQSIPWHLFIYTAPTCLACFRKVEMQAPCPERKQNPEMLSLTLSMESPLVPGTTNWKFSGSLLERPSKKLIWFAQSSHTLSALNPALESCCWKAVPRMGRCSPLPRETTNTHVAATPPGARTMLSSPKFPLSPTFVYFCTPPGAAQLGRTARSPGLQVGQAIQYTCWGFKILQFCRPECPSDE
jgi:hypothetical protein